jgi:hypothetical protein
MLVSFNPYLSNTNNPKKVNFKSLKDGKIVAEEVAKYASNAKLCCHDIYHGGYKPTGENLQALLEAKKIAAKDEYSGLEKLDWLNEAIETLKKKAAESGINL